jgi:hypothetical protein
MKKSLLILIILCVFAACNQSKTRTSRYTSEQIAALQIDSTVILNAETDSLITIDLNPFLKKQLFDLGSLIKELKIIPLETTDESLLDDIYKILITETNIYIYDDFKGGGLAIFDKSGRFVKRISHGGGPGEIFRLWDVAYDMENNEILAYQQPFLYHYSSNGEFIRREKLLFGFYNFMVTPDGYVFKTLHEGGNEHLDNMTKYSMFITDRKFKLKAAGLPFLYPDVINYLGKDLLYGNSRIITATHNFTDTIYQYESKNNRLKAAYVLDYSKKKFPEQYLQRSFREFENETQQNDYYYYLGEYLETERQNVFFLRNEHIGMQTIVYRDKKSGNLTGGTFAAYDDIKEIPSMTFPYATSGDWFIASHFPDKKDSSPQLDNSILSDEDKTKLLGLKDSSLLNSSILSDEDKVILKNLTEDDNPVLVLFKLNDF